MEQEKPENLEENESKENSMKLLGKKTIRFSVEKESENKKFSLTKNKEENLNEGRWSYREQIQFIKTLNKVGTNWRKFKETINNRSLPQIRSHAQKFFKRFKKCKIKELGIDFTSKKIRSIKDMINHIKSVNSNYDIKNAFLYLTDNRLSNLVEIMNGTHNKNNINISNISPHSFTKDNNNFGLNNPNKILLLDSINKININFNTFIINYVSESMITSNLINKFYINYLENMSDAPSDIERSSFLNNQDFFNYSNINENGFNKDNI